MKNYETIWEIFNKCPNNQMRDVFIDEVEVADTDAYIRQKFQDKNATWEKSVLPDGTIVYDINGLHQGAARVLSRRTHCRCRL